MLIFELPYNARWETFQHRVYCFSHYSKISASYSRIVTYARRWAGFSWRYTPFADILTLHSPCCFNAFIAWQTASYSKLQYRTCIIDFIFISLFSLLSLIFWWRAILIDVFIIFSRAPCRIIRKKLSWYCLSGQCITIPPRTFATTKPVTPAKRKLLAAAFALIRIFTVWFILMVLLLSRIWEIILITLIDYQQWAFARPPLPCVTSQSPLWRLAATTTGLAATD